MHHILCVESDIGLQRLMADVLVDAGYAVTNACRGTEAVGLLLEHSDRFDVLLTEADLPDEITGISLASFSRRMRPGRPTVFITVKSETFTEWLQGNEAILHKPFNNQALLAAMSIVCSHRG